MKEQRRVYPMEPRTIMQTSFAKTYLNYLLPELANIGKPASSLSVDRYVDKEIEKTVRYEVDMALALSAQGFAWSHALEHKLRLNVNNNNQVGKSQSYLSHDGYRNTMPVNHEPATEKLEGNPKRSGTEAAAEEEERLTYLRKLIPGGSGEMMLDDEILLSELGSYVSCLELQVNVLRSVLQLN
ncbi:hypothetical protein F3Y22_tig00111582pilonHSYRG00116 [Hibiscus syriacus]|uniref:IBH1-like N-terminal domain-containing protein n=1 Tax=Hibiscus syriacus TaxID=106335 RepID=A0A6A2XK50_HIBSY|nr:transcription factor bHLH146-like [Hibiscus syriacus]KAE8676621.1 hypothetical protein F3Y22_tig00111582pilonHSYRG00116 [Hibiscus syriacus]